MSKRHISDYNFINSAGYDKTNRQLVAIYACRFPPIADYSIKEVAEYIKSSLESISYQEYSILFFNDCLKEYSITNFRKLWNIHNTFDYRSRKNLKFIYLVHASAFLKYLINAAWFFVRSKVYAKICFMNNLSEIKKYATNSKLNIPETIILYDKSLNPTIPFEVDQSEVASNSVFGLNLEEILIKTEDRYNLPKFLESCFAKLESEGIYDRGIFRVPPRLSELNTVISSANTEYDCSHHPSNLVASLLKRFLSSLPFPLLGKTAWDSMKIFSSDQDESFKSVTELFKQLPAPNKVLLRRLMGLIHKIDINHDRNNMSISNLAIVLSPSLIWGDSKDPMALKDSANASAFVEYVFKIYPLISDT